MLAAVYVQFFSLSLVSFSFFLHYERDINLQTHFLEVVKETLVLRFLSVATVMYLRDKSFPRIILRVSRLQNEKRFSP